MNRRTFLAAGMSSTVLAYSSGYAADPKLLELFGVALKGASRDELRAVLKKQSLRPLQEDKNTWGDTYSAEGVLEGASELFVGYVRDDKFAYARYTFEAFMDTQLVEKVINTVSTKYGRPSSVQGSYSLGPVTAVWKLDKGGQIEVTRGWPDTTTYLRLIDSPAYAQMRAEMESDRKADAAQKAKAQSKAF